MVKNKWWYKGHQRRYIYHLLSNVILGHLWVSPFDSTEVSTPWWQWKFFLLEVARDHSPLKVFLFILFFWSQNHWWIKHSYYYAWFKYIWTHSIRGIMSFLLLLLFFCYCYSHEWDIKAPSTGICWCLRGSFAPPAKISDDITGLCSRHSLC